MITKILSEGGRKYSLALLALALLACGLFFDKLGGGEFVAGLGIVFGIFAAGNGYEMYQNGRQRRPSGITGAP